MLDPLLAQLPAELDELAVAVRGKVDQTLERTLQLDAHAVEVEDGLQELLLGALDCVAGLLLALAWLAALASRRSAVPLLFRDHPWLAYAIVAFLTWSLASVLWAEDPVSARVETTRLIQNAILLFIVFSAIAKRQHLLWVLGAYLGGAFLTAVVGLAGGSSSEQFNPYADTSRLSGGIGDPNELAAILIPAVAIAAFLIPTTREPLMRWLLFSLVLVISLALFFTQSRGGLLALAVVIVVTPLLAGPVRLRAVAVILAIAALGIGYFALIAPPQAIQHVTRFSVGSGTGREDLWRVSIRMFENHPFAGVATGNFQVIEPRYALQDINLRRPDFIVETPKVAHNTYLHILTELGLVGISAFGSILIGSLLIAGIEDRDGRSVPNNNMRLRLQTIDNQQGYWLDTGILLDK